MEENLLPPKQLKATISVTLEVGLATWMDAWALERGMSRSAVVAEALDLLRDAQEIGR